MKKRKQIIIIVLISVLFLIAITVTGIILWRQFRTPTISEMEKSFMERTSEFAELRDMIQADTHLTSVGNDRVNEYWLYHNKWTTHKPPYAMFSEEEMLKEVVLTEEDYNKYLDLLDKVGAYRVDINPDRDEIKISVFRRGIVPSGTTIDIVYTNRDYDKGESDCKTESSSYSCVTKVDTDWYIEKVSD